MSPYFQTTVAEEDVLRILVEAVGTCCKMIDILDAMMFLVKKFYASCMQQMLSMTVVQVFKTFMKLQTKVGLAS